MKLFRLSAEEAEMLFPHYPGNPIKERKELFMNGGKRYLLVRFPELLARFDAFFPELQEKKGSEI